MYRDATIRERALWILPLMASAMAMPAMGQPAGVSAGWRRIGNTAIDLSLAAEATGPVDRVWYSPDGGRLYARTPSGRVFVTADFETWKEAPAAPPEADERVVANQLPEAGVRLRRADGQPVRLYAAGRFAYRSDDGGRSWRNLTEHADGAVIGEGLSDLAVSPQDPDQIAVAGPFGVWRSLDGGLSWDGLNRQLPNLPVRRLTAVPAGARGVRVQTEAGELEWAPGERQAWRVSDGGAAAAEMRALALASLLTGLRVTAQASSGSVQYAGSEDGWLAASTDGGANWTRERAGARVVAFAFDPAEPRTAVAATAAGRVLRTTNGGLGWDDLTANLGVPEAYGIAADRVAGALYVATSRGLFLSYADLQNPSPAAPWQRVAGLPDASVRDVRLDAAGNQLYAAVDGYGVFATLAPHRLRALRVVSSADYQPRAAAPGALLSVLGARVRTVRLGDLTVPILAATEGESQIQIPFEASGQTAPLALETGAGSRALGIPLRKAAPAIFVDRDGTPMMLDGDSGILLDAMHPARAGTRIQILAAGLGAVRPDWPTGLAAPIDNPPSVISAVRVLLDGAEVEILRATLAPGYVGFYLVEVRIPDLVDRGAAELHLEVEGQASNRVRVYLEP
ncbi:MAG TPA: hypothetical protein DEH78_03615 [Solibacterales bacterium]|nr:hypothetical protein [Bryobacterales bacterium]